MTVLTSLQHSTTVLNSPIAGPLPVQLPAHFKVEDALGWLTCAFFIFNTYMCACALLTNYAILTIFSFLEIAELCLFIGNFSGAVGWVRAGGYFGFFAALAGEKGAKCGVLALCVSGDDTAAGLWSLRIESGKV